MLLFCLSIILVLIFPRLANFFDKMANKRTVSAVAPSSPVQGDASPKKIKSPPVKSAQDQSLASGLIYEVRLHKCEEGIQLYSVVSNQDSNDAYLRNIVDAIRSSKSANDSDLTEVYHLRGDVARRKKWDNNDPMKNVRNRFERKFFVQYAPDENDIFFRNTAFAIIAVSVVIYVLLESLLLLTHLFTHC